MTYSPPERPDPEKSSVKIVMFEGSKTIAASLASALHPLRIISPLMTNTLKKTTITTKE